MKLGCDFVRGEPRRSHPLCGMSSWRVGGEADFFCEPESQEDIFYFLKWAKAKNVPVSFLGGGTNVLISDQGVEGLLMCLRKLVGCHVYEVNGRLCVNALAGVSKAEIMRVFLKRNLAPALFLCGLPGDVAGGVVMNAGVGGFPPSVSGSSSVKDLVRLPREFRDIVDWVKVIREGKTVLVRGGDIEWEYRASRGWGPGLIYEVGMSWPVEPPVADLPALVREVALKRAGSQPLQSASCGSVFKNPLEGKKSGMLIEECGLKGFEIGQARVSEKHANFIVNKGGACARDIDLLIRHIQRVVQKKTGVLLQPEVRYMGRWPGVAEDL